VHEHVLKRLLTYISDQNVRVTTTDGKSEIARHKPAKSAWAVRPSTRKKT
jgi:hypothetical protein